MTKDYSNAKGILTIQDLLAERNRLQAENERLQTQLQMERAIRRHMETQRMVWRDIMNEVCRAAIEIAREYGAAA